MADYPNRFVVLGFACADDVWGLKISPPRPLLLEVAAVKAEMGAITGHFSCFIAPGECDARDINIGMCNPGAYGITEDHLIGAPSFKEVARRVCEFARGCAPIAMPDIFGTAKIFAEDAAKYNFGFDLPLLHFGELFPLRKFLPEKPSSMEEVFEKYNIFLLDKSLMPSVRCDLLTWALCYARLALALADI